VVLPAFLFFAHDLRRLYATVTDRVRVAASLLTIRIAQGRLASPFTAREIYRNDWTGLTEPRVVGEALACQGELGWIRPEAAIARDGGRPTVRFHINPRVACRRESRGGFVGFVGWSPTRRAHKRALYPIGVYFKYYRVKPLIDSHSLYCNSLCLKLNN
jgi:hypothetical protein